MLGNLGRAEGEVGGGGQECKVVLLSVEKKDVISVDGEMMPTIIRWVSCWCNPAYFEGTGSWHSNDNTNITYST